MSEAMTWKGNEKLSAFLVPIGSLVPDPTNARKHNDKNLAAVEGSLKLFGQQELIVVKDGVVRAGSARLTVAKERLGWTHIAAVDSDLSSETALAGFAIADNRTGELASWDHEILSATLKALTADDMPLVDLGWDTHELELYLQADWKPPAIGEGGGETSKDTGRTLTFSETDWAALQEAAEAVREETGDPGMPLAAAVVYLASSYLAR